MLNEINKVNIEARERERDRQTEKGKGNKSMLCIAAAS
jgi:hypothetical protein